MMMDERVVSEEILNAFIDGEIESEDKIEILYHLSENPRLTKRVCELIRTKERLRAAYRSATPDQESTAVSISVNQWKIGRFGYLGRVAASLLVVVLLFGRAPHAPLSEVVLSGQGAIVPTAFHQAEEQAAVRILFHLTSDNPLRMGKLLDDVQLLLDQSQQSTNKMVVEVIANSDGLDLFRSDITAYSDRIHLMSKENNNIRFVACQQTIDRIESGGTGKVHLLPVVERAGSGISQVVERQQQGWSYIQS